MANSCGVKLVITLIGITIFYISFAFGTSAKIENDGKDLVYGDMRLVFLGNVGSKAFYVGENKTTWSMAVYECFTFGMELVRTDNVPEWDFARMKNYEGHGPFWFGARDFGRKELYIWSTVQGYPSGGDPIESFASFYYSSEDGHMALKMDPAYGGTFVGVHSHKVDAKAFCQRASSQPNLLD